MVFKIVATFAKEKEVGACYWINMCMKFKKTLLIYYSCSFAFYIFSCQLRQM